jgi:D-beta-D-heptose 7-phosphate kinase / D-beta-D-heptose 1-phosphate adenosyltransferase
MTTDVVELVRDLDGLNVLVIGDAILDSYLVGTADRICREAPVPIVALADRVDSPGGAANTAVNAAALGADVRLLTIVGDDREGRVLARSLTSRGVAPADLVADDSRETLSKNRLVADSQILVRFDRGSTEAAGPATEERVIERLRAAFPAADAVVVSDYGYGVLTPRVIDALAELQAASPTVIVVDAKFAQRFRHVGVTAVKPNHAEAARLLGVSPQLGPARSASVERHADELFELTGAQMVVVTLDVDGAILLERGRPLYRTYARPSSNAKATGAGDTFTAALSLALGAGAHAVAAVELASTAASVVVEREGTSACSATQLLDRIGGKTTVVSGPDAVERLAAAYRRDGRRVVFTNGCFDILHRGHITYLNQAKALGDVLIVGLNSDDSVRRLKGPERPINSLDDRAHVLAALSCIDHIVPFDEDTPVGLIERVRPDVFVKGGDYRPDMLPERGAVESLGGVVHILPYVEDRSTTGIIQHIRAAPGDARPAQELRTGT